MSVVKINEASPYWRAAELEITHGAITLSGDYYCFTKSVSLGMVWYRVTSCFSWCFRSGWREKPSPWQPVKFAGICVILKFLLFLEKQSWNLSLQSSDSVLVVLEGKHWLNYLSNWVHCQISDVEFYCNLSDGRGGGEKAFHKCGWKGDTIQTTQQSRYHTRLPKCNPLAISGCFIITDSLSAVNTFFGCALL